MTWIPEKLNTVVDRFQVHKGLFETELEAHENADQDERPKFRRFTVAVDTFRCSDCGRVHVAEMTEEVKDESGTVTKKAEPIEPEPCDHQHGERDPGPKQPWE